MAPKKFLFVHAVEFPGRGLSAIVHSAAHPTALSIPKGLSREDVRTILTRMELPGEDATAISEAYDLFFQPPDTQTFIRYAVEVIRPTIVNQQHKNIWKHEKDFFDPGQMTEWLGERSLLGTHNYRVAELDTSCMSLPVSKFSLAKKHDRKNMEVYSIQLMPGGFQFMGWVRTQSYPQQEKWTRVVWINDYFGLTGWESVAW